MNYNFSHCESAFLNNSNYQNPSTPVPYIVVDHYPDLGLLTALRFLEWVTENPEGVISLPTGKTPEYFIKWTHYLLSNWTDPAQETLRRDKGLDIDNKPDLSRLQFIQIDEFYPINPSQTNSFHNYVQEFYIKGFKLNTDRGLFINCETIPRTAGKSLDEIFPDSRVDLSLRTRDPKNALEETQQETILLVDQWCTEYEEKVRELGGIGFFLGGIGPDGHIAFNVRGSDHNSTTRLTGTNFETQAAAATDLGGIEISRNRLVITIGLATITSNPDTTAIIMAAGEAKADIVKASLEHNQDIHYPATVLQKLKGGRFYLTKGAAVGLKDVVIQDLQHESWTQEKTERSVVQLCQRLNKFGHHLTLEELKNDHACSLIPNLNENTVSDVIDAFKMRLDKAVNMANGETVLHTGPHHDDIILGYLPLIIHQIRSPTNKHYFANMTSGFTSVTNSYLYGVLRKTAEFLKQGKVQMINYPDFFDEGYRFKWDKDVYHYLDRIAANNKEGQSRGLSHRLVRILVEIYGLQSVSDLNDKIVETFSYLESCYDGEKNKPDIQRMKGMVREFEEELAWAHYGVKVKDIHHLRLGFYKGDIFTENPQEKRDVAPVLGLIRNINPTIITLAMDPEGSGPDTHYKVLQTLAEALRLWQQDTDLENIRIWGYRNVWYRFDPAEADILVPVSLNSMATLRDTFMTCYLSQQDASFPSYELDGPFCDLTQKVWVEQHELMELVLGRNFWYEHEHPQLRATHGLVFLKEMSADQFLVEARRLERSMEGVSNFTQDN
ncbi:MAG TPA: glucosamine-6-phosphate isomerase [Candidatus Marinimicrobia bacterium]|nr:glucosamine-6-phosphate isomerase [Candidatus Neomarinimicrobiota bacterium]